MIMRTSIYCWTLFTVLFILAYLLQLQIYIHPDVIYLMNIALRLISGGRYTHDFFETNPPMIMYLYLPAIYLAKLTSINIIYIFRLYILALILISVLMSASLLKKILRNDLLMYYWMLALLILILCFFPAHEFGQREHFLMILIMPYLFANILRLNNERLAASLTILIGIFAGIGLSLKPFFLTLIILPEIYILYHTKNLKQLLRLELMTIIIFLLAYSLLILYFYTDYIFIALPIIFRFYFIGMSKSFSSALTYMNLIYCFLTCALYILFYKRSQYPLLTSMLFVSLISLIFSVLIPHTMFIYQMMPALSIALLLLGFGLGQFIHEYINSERNDVKQFNPSSLLMLAFLLVFAFPFTESAFYFKLGILTRQDVTTKKFLQFIENHADKNYIFLSASSDTMIADLYPGPHLHYVGSFSAFWWEQGLAKLKKQTKTAIEKIRLATAEQFLIDIIIRDLNIKKPNFILIDISNNIKINYMKQFMQFEEFRDAFAAYQYYSTIGSYEIFIRN